jgi:hypothetical protein
MMQPFQGKNIRGRILFSRGGAALTLGYRLLPFQGKKYAYSACLRPVMSLSTKRQTKVSSSTNKMVFSAA